MYDKQYFEKLLRRSALQFWIRKFYFIPLRPYLKGNILDLGCGIGELAEHIQNREFYFGVDINPYCVDYLNQQKIHAKLGSAYEIPFEAGCMDVVFLSHVLEHLEDPDRAMNEISRVLKPGGLLIIIVPMINGFQRDSTHRIFYDRSRLLEVAQSNNYLVKSVTCFPAYPEFLGKFLYFFEYRLFAQKKS
jgi:SAM-dependent methyltransferase